MSHCVHCYCKLFPQECRHKPISASCARTSFRAYCPCNIRTNKGACDSVTSRDMFNSVYQSLQRICQALFQPAKQIVKSLCVHTNALFLKEGVFVLVDKQHLGLVQLYQYIFWTVNDTRLDSKVYFSCQILQPCKCSILI